MADQKIFRATRVRQLTRRRMLQVAGLGGVGTVAAAGLGCNTRQQGSPSQGSSTSGQPAGQPRRGGTFTYYWNANPPGLDPMFNATGATTSFASAMMSSLFRFK